MPVKMVSFWGKGGVGKTTCSAALATGLSEVRNQRVLLLTTDMTPSLSHVLGAEVGKWPGRVEGYRNLFALELDERSVIERWKERFGKEVYEVISSLIPVDESFIDYVAGAPGIAEQFTLYVLHELFKGGEFDVIVWDTPASSSSLRLLRIEREVYEHMGEALKMYLRLKSFLDKIRSRESDPLKLISEWRELAESIFDMLACDEHFAYIVATPERISYEISKKIHEELTSFGIKVRGVIVNKYIDVESLSVLKRRQDEVLESFTRDFNPIKLIEYQDNEILGKSFLLSFYRKLENFIQI